MANNVTVNYDDKRFGQVEADKSQAMTELEQTYGGMINNTDKYYQAQIDASKQWADKQTQLQQEQTDFAIEQIEQQKDQSHKDYLKEQSGAYVDWQKQSNQYGANAEQQASAGLQNTGFSESSQVAMYTAYQNRVAVARDSYNRAVLNYDNAIKDARLQNNAALAEIAFEALKNQLQLSLEGFQYKNQLILDKANQKTELGNIYHNRYLDVLNQINTENALTEQMRQFNEEIALQKEKFAEDKRQFNEQMALQKAKSSGGGGGGGGGDTPSYTPTKDDTPVPKATTQNYHGVDQKTSDQLQKEVNYKDAVNYFNKMIAAGASENQVLAEIASAQKAGELTKTESKKLREIFNPRGVQY